MMNAAPRSVFISGANRGIGLELVRQFLAISTPPKHIIATCRRPEEAAELKGLAEKNASIKVLKYDADKTEEFPALQQSVAEIVGEDGLNLLINNAGIAKRHPLEDVSEESLMNMFKINAVAPLLLTKAFLPLLKKCAASSPKEMSYQHAMVVNMSSKVGSVGDNGMGGLYEYRLSKAAMNMAGKNLSIDFNPLGILVLTLHPGWVQTDMGGPNALISSTQCVSGLLKVIAEATEKSAGNFYDYKGLAIPW